MSKREKNLLSLLLLVALVTSVLLGFKRVYQPRYKKAQRTLAAANAEARTSESLLNSINEFKAEMDWINTNEPTPTTQQKAQSTLQSKCESLANDATLEIKQQRPLSSVKVEGAYYHRARMDMIVTGLEANFYKWVVSLNSPEKFRGITSMTLYPQKSDDTLIEARVTIEQWFTPETL